MFVKVLSMHINVQVVPENVNFYSLYDILIHWNRNHPSLKKVTKRGLSNIDLS